MKVAFDTNVLVYAEDVHGVAKQEVARGLIRHVGYQSIGYPPRCLVSVSTSHNEGKATGG
jgi:hypothetical protein